MNAQASAIGRLAGVLARLDDETAARLLGSLAEIPQDELIAAGDKVARMRPSVLRRLLNGPIGRWEPPAAARKPGA